MLNRHSSLSLRSSHSPHNALLTAAVLAALAASVPAQLQFEELPRRGLPVDNDSPSAVALGDVDGDGDLDMVFANFGYPGEQNRLYLNDGSGVFSDATATHMPVMIGATRAMALGDVDGDGDLDIVTGAGNPFGGLDRLYLNDGSGVFSDATATHMPVMIGATMAMALGDVDGDGDLDMVRGNNDYFGQQNRLYLNNGLGVFTDVTATRMPVVFDDTDDVALGDVDGDGDLDMVVANSKYPNQTLLYSNDGTGTFTDVTAAQLPVNLDRIHRLELGDVDGDGDLDMVSGSIGTGPVGGQNLLYVNNGAGLFTNVTATQMPAQIDWTNAMALGDVDGDGDLDMVFGNASFISPSIENKLFLNDGAGVFSDVTAPRMPVALDIIGDVALGDVDGDGDLDMVFGNSGQNRLLQNLHCQLHAPVDLQIGQTYTLDAYMRYGPPSVSDFALPVVSFLPASPPVQVPPYGTLGLAQPLLAFPLIVIPQPAGVGSLNITVPNLPSYVGISLYSQALLVPVTLDAKLSNVVFDVLQ